MVNTFAVVVNEIYHSSGISTFKLIYYSYCDTELSFALPGSVGKQAQRGCFCLSGTSQINKKYFDNFKLL